MTNKSSSGKSKIYQLYLKLKGTSPPLWRRLMIRGDATLAELHQAIQCMMGWEEEHLHVFKIGEKEYGIKKYTRDAIDEKRVMLDKALAGISEFMYVYDFRSPWKLKISIEEVLSSTELSQPTCTGGQRPSPGENEVIWGDEIPARQRRPSFDPENANQCIRSWTPNPLMHR